MSKQNYELLSPAGDFPSLIAAVENGADAVYFGLNEKGLNMRQGAKNFNIKDLVEIDKICKNNNVKKSSYNAFFLDKLNNISHPDNINVKIKYKYDILDRKVHEYPSSNNKIGHIIANIYDGGLNDILVLSLTG